jgi:hypothetical protein
MAEIPVIIRLVNPKDAYTRIAAAWVDKVPPSDWTRNIIAYGAGEAARTFVTQEGKLEFTTTDLKDGAHKIYIAVSQDERSTSLGVWSGTASVGGIVKSFDRIDYDTLGLLEFSLKGGKVVDSSKPAPNGNTVPAPTSQLKGWPKVKAILTADLVMIEAFAKEHKVPLAIGGAGAGAVIGFLIWQKKKRRY